MMPQFADACLRNVTFDYEVVNISDNNKLHKFSNGNLGARAAEIRTPLCVTVT